MNAANALICPREVLHDNILRKIRAMAQTSPLRDGKMRHLSCRNDRFMRLGANWCRPTICSNLKTRVPNLRTQMNPARLAPPHARATLCYILPGNICFETTPSMPSSLAHLSPAEQQQLLDDLNYLNMAEIREICEKHKIPYVICVETPDGKSRKTGERDRKGVVLERLRLFLRTGRVGQETCFPADVVRFDAATKELVANDRLFYGRYDKNNRQMVALLKSLTKGAFQNGAVARILAREFWAAGKAPTFQEFAAAWLKTRAEHTRPNPEWAFLTDRANKTAGRDWKKLRNQKAKKVLAALSKIERGMKSK